MAEIDLPAALGTHASGVPAAGSVRTGAAHEATVAGRR
jgi:hypothetical protein